MNLDGLFNISILGDKVGVDLWNYTNKKDGNLNKMLNWLIPYAFEVKEREYKQINQYKTSNLYRLLVIASKKYKGNYLKSAGQVPAIDKVNLTTLLYK